MSFVIGQKLTSLLSGDKESAHLLSCAAKGNCHGAVPYWGVPNPHCFQSFSQPQIP